LGVEEVDMRRTIAAGLLLSIAPGCSDGGTTGSQHFSWSEDGVGVSGDGVAFLRADGSLHIRGLSGNSRRLAQIDIVAPTTTAVDLPLDARDASWAEILGGDAVSQTFLSRGARGDRLTVTTDRTAMFAEGTFAVEAHSEARPPVVKRLAGTFRIPVGAAGQPWDCGLRSEPLAGERCRFLQ
jgi:hypothetical protein